MQLARASLGTLLTRFGELSAPTEDQLRGRFRAQFVGPWWLRISAGPSIALAGLPGFWGKDLAGFGVAHNVLQRRGERTRGLTMELSVGSSLRDGRGCAHLFYPPGSPFPWPHVRDELRVLSEGVLLGLTILMAPLLQRLAFPFLLVRSEA